MNCTPVELKITFQAQFYGEIPRCPAALNRENRMEVATQVFKGLAEFFHRHCQNPEDIDLANRVATKNLNSYDFALASNLLQKYWKFVQIDGDCKYLFCGSPPVVYCEFTKKIESADIERWYNYFRFANPGIDVTRESEQCISFPIFLISSAGWQSIETFNPDNCTVL